MWPNFLGEYSGDFGDAVIMALIPYIFWVQGRLSSLTAYGQVDRIPRWLQWIPWTNPQFRNAMERGETPSGNKLWENLWKGIALGMGLILPTVYLVRGPLKPLGHRIAVVLVSAVVFLLAVALLEWLVRPKGSKEQ